MISGVKVAIFFCAFLYVFYPCKGQETAEPQTPEPEGSSTDGSEVTAVNEEVSPDASSNNDCEMMEATPQQKTACEQEGRNVIKACKAKMWPCKVLCIYETGPSEEKNLEKNTLCCDIGVIPTGMCNDDGQCISPVSVVTGMLGGK